MYYENVYCPECGCEDVTMYDDGGRKGARNLVPKK